MPQGDIYSDCPRRYVSSGSIYQIIEYERGFNQSNTILPCQRLGVVVHLIHKWCYLINLLFRSQESE